MTPKVVTQAKCMKLHWVDLFWVSPIGTMGLTHWSDQLQPNLPIF